SRLDEAWPRNAATSRATSSAVWPPSVSVRSSSTRRSGARGAERGLVRALLRLVLGARLRRVDVAERRVRRHELPCDGDAEPLRQHRAERLDLHLAEARQGGDAPAQVGAVGCLRPDTGGVAAVLGDDVRAQLLNALGHGAREAVDRGALAERRFEA